MTVFVGLYVSCLEDEWLWGFGGLKSSDTLPFRVFTDAIFILPFIPTDLKVRGYSPSASRLSDAFSV